MIKECKKKKGIQNLHQVNQQQKDCQPKANKYWCRENKYNGLWILSRSHSMAARLAITVPNDHFTQAMSLGQRDQHFKHLKEHVAPSTPQEVATSQNHCMPPQSVAIDHSLHKVYDHLYHAVRERGGFFFKTGTS